MIARLTGELIEKERDRVVIDVQGVGYQVFVSLATFYKLGEPGFPATLAIHTHVRDDALWLFGFHDRAERNMFNLLISVSGIGPKLALNILSGMEVPALANAIGTAAYTDLTRISGLGKKTAERLVVELKDKVTELMARPDHPIAAPLIDFNAEDHDVISALTNLGYRLQLAEQALAKVKRTNPQLSGVEETLREVLKTLSRMK